MFLSKKTATYLTIIIVLTLMSISSIHAIDLENATVDDHHHATAGRTDRIRDQSTSNNFNDLNNDLRRLSPGDVYNVTQDYNFSSLNYNFIGENPGITISVDNITINGNGHIIDGNHQSALFKITGNDVKIFNLTIVNGEYQAQSITIKGETKNASTTTPTYEYTYDVSPIEWKGDNGLISNCTIFGNTAINGGAISWSGNNGLITHTVFMNNTARGIGGAIYLSGRNNKIKDSLFMNSISQLSGEAIYIDRNCESYDVTGIFYKCQPIIDGKTTNIDVDYLRYSIISKGANTEVDLIKLIYSSIANNYVHYYGDNSIYFSSYNGTDFVLNFAKTFNDVGIIYGKTYIFSGVSNYNDIFKAVLNDNYKNNLTYIKNFEVHNKDDYEKAMNLDESVFSDQVFLSYIANDLSSMSSYNIYKELNINFAGQYTFNSKATWKPSNAFNMITINGNGSKISVSTGDRDEDKWAVLENTDCIFCVSGLTIEGFNMGVENLGGRCVFNNVIFNNNRMDYIIDQDYGAAICNTGECICNNCTFTNNYCKHGGAIFSQGRVELNNCKFEGNYAYGHGDNICNADKGIVKINGIEIKGTKDLVYHAKSLSKTKITVLSVLTIALAGTLGLIVGTFSGNPILGICIGGLLGGGLGGGMSAYICSNFYDVTYDKSLLCIGLIISSTMAGACCGAIGGYLASVPTAGVEAGGEVGSGLATGGEVGSGSSVSQSAMVSSHSSINIGSVSSYSSSISSIGAISSSSNSGISISSISSIYSAQVLDEVEVINFEGINMGEQILENMLLLVGP